MDETTLIQRLEQDDPHAVRELYDQFGDRVFSVVRSNVRDEWDAEEVTQDVIWKVYEKIDTFRRNSALWSWMYRIAVNEARMKTRKYDRHPVPVEDDALSAMVDDERSDASPVPEEHTALQELLEEVRAYLEESTEANRKIYVDLDVDGATKDEVAEELDLSVSAVKARLHRMRVGLRERVRENYLQTA